MLLALDVGNTNVTVGAFKGDRLLHLWRLATDPKKTADEYGSSLRAMVLDYEGAGKPQAVVYGSVVPSLNPVFEAAARRYFGVEALGVGPESPLGLRLRVRAPGEVGADRVLNALAAWKLYGAPAVVIDFGTATTFDCLSARGEYLGGAILVGPRVAAAALSQFTAKLPLVEPRRPDRVIGKDTVECIQAGLYHGYLGMLERVLERTLEEMKPSARGRRVRIIATGGVAPLFAEDLPRATIVAPDLTLQGLRLAWDLLSVKARLPKKGRLK